MSSLLKQHTLKHYTSRQYITNLTSQSHVTSKMSNVQCIIEDVYHLFQVDASKGEASINQGHCGKPCQDRQTKRNKSYYK